MDADDAGLWVVRIDGQSEEKYRLDAVLSRADPHPIWSPDGRWLAFSSTPQGEGSGLWLAEVGTWALYSLDMAPDAQLVNWVSPLGN
jgi:Tol biopolymer transport system component